MACVFILRHSVISTYIGSGYPIVLLGSCFWCVRACVRSPPFLCPLYIFLPLNV